MSNPRSWFLKALKDAAILFSLAAITMAAALLAMLYRAELLHFLQ